MKQPEFPFSPWRKLCLLASLCLMCWIWWPDCCSLSSPLLKSHLWLKTGFICIIIIIIDLPNFQFMLYKWCIGIRFKSRVSQPKILIRLLYIIDTLTQRHDDVDIKQKLFGTFLKWMNDSSNTHCFLSAQFLCRNPPWWEKTCFYFLLKVFVKNIQ